MMKLPTEVDTRQDQQRQQRRISSHDHRIRRQTEIQERGSTAERVIEQWSLRHER